MARAKTSKVKKSAISSKDAENTVGKKLASRGNKRPSNDVKNNATKENHSNSMKRPKLQHSSNKGHVVSCGQGDIGQLGQGEDVYEKPKPGPVIFGKDIENNFVDIAAGGMHTVCLTADGNVYTFGCNDEGALGRVTDGKEGAEFVPGKVNLPKKIVQVSAGDSHTCALSDDGDVYVWGNFRDASGSMGLISPGKYEVEPKVLIDDIRIQKIDSGSDHLVCLTDYGSLLTCGCAEQGQLGRLAECFTSRGGRKGVDVLLKPSEVRIKKSRGKPLVFEDVWAGSYVTFAKVKDRNEIYAFGLNNYLQLGLDDIKNRYVPELVKSFNGKKWLSISGGQHHTLALDDTGQVYSIGRKEYGRLGLGKDCEDAAVPTSLSTLEGKKCSQIACGVCVSFAVDDEGKVYSWGMGTNSQLGHGDTDDRYIPTQISSKPMLSRRVYKVSSGGQHTVILAVKLEPS